MRKLLLVLVALCVPSIVHADLFGLAPPFLAATKKASAPLLAFTALANGTVGGSPIAGSGTYTGTAPTSISTATWGGGCSGSSTPAGFSASTGTWSATFTVPSGAGTGCTIAITDNRSDTATSPGVTISSGGSPIALVASGKIAGNGSGGGTSGSLNTTGSTLLVMVIGWYSGDAEPPTSPPYVTDSNTNTWIAIPGTRGVSGGAANITIYYAANPTVSSSQTFTANYPSSYTTTAIFAFSGVATVSPLDTSNAAGSGGTSVTTQQTGSVTPANNGSVVIAGVSQFIGGQTFSINGSFTGIQQDSSGGAINCAGAYLIQTTATAANPTWTSTSSGSAAADIAVFHQ